MKERRDIDMIPIMEEAPVEQAKSVVSKELDSILASFGQIKTYLKIDTELSEAISYDVEACRRKVMSIKEML